MKYIRRQNLNQQNALDKKVLIKPNGDIEFNPTSSVTVNGEFITVGTQVAGPEVTNVMYVTLDGDDANDGKGEGPRQAKRTIKSACDVAQEGTTIFVRSGEYYEDNPIRVPPKVSIIGDNLRRTIIKPLNGTTKWNITHIQRIDGLVIVTTDVEHDLTVADRVRVVCSQADIDDENATIVTIPDSMSFTYNDYGTNLIYAAATGTVERGTDLFLVNSQVYIAQLVIRSLPAPAYCINIDNEAIVDTSPYIQNCSNINGPWLNNGEEWLPFITEQRNTAGVMVTGPRPLLDEELDPAYLDVYGINQRGGGGGMLIDGDRYSSVSPIQSMVADAFTQVAQGAVGFHITNFGYMQLVSCFNVFCHIAYYTTKGGYLSISNSVCDFGNYAFVADGYYRTPYDSGVITTDYYSSVGSVIIDTTGSNYTIAPAVIFDPPTTPGSVQAEGTAIIDTITGKLVAISIDEPGSGYDFQPNITLTGGGVDPGLVQGTATANLQKNITVTVNNLSNKPQVGSIIFFGNDPTGYYISSTSNSNQTFVYNERKCRRDVELILNAILTDMTFGSNYSSVAAGLSYIRSYAAKVTSLQKAQTIAGLNEARDLAIALTVNPSAQAAINDNFGIVTDIIDAGVGAAPAVSIPSSLTREEGYSQAKDILLANKLFIQDEITAWIAYNYSVLDYDSVTCSRDVGLIIDALCYDLMFGSNFRTITAARSYYRAGAAVVTQSQKEATLGAFRYLKTIAAAKINDNSTAVASVESNMDIIINVLENGLDEIGALIRPDPTGYSNNYKFARNLINENKEFIKAEVSAYLNINYTAIWTALSPAGQANCQRDTGYILDALYYDLTYGGNLETTIAGRAYYSFSVLQIDPTEKAATLAAYDHMRIIIGDIAQNIDIVQLQGSVLQVTGLPGSLTAANSAKSLIQNVIDIIDTNVYTDVAPSTAWVSTALVEKNTALQYARSSIQDSVIKYINSNNFIYNSTTCRRDISYIIDAMAYDLAYGGNTQTANAAAAYVEGSVIAGQVEETLAAYKYWKTIVGNIVRNIEINTTPGNNTGQDTSINKGSPVPVSGPASYTQELLQIIIDVVDHGTGYIPDPVTLPEYSVGDGALSVIRTDILDNVATIQDSVIDYLNNSYGGNIDVTLFPAVQQITAGTVARLHNVSTISTGGTAMEYVGAGVTYNALPFFGGEPIPENERIEINNGKCFTVTNDQVGNFRVGSIFRVNALTGEVTIDAENISLSGISSIGPFKRNGIYVGVQLKEVSDNTNLIASIGTQDINTVPTQNAVSQYVENRYLNKVTTDPETVASNSITFDGSIAVNGGTLSTTYSNFSLVNAAATTVNFAGEATTVNIGDATGTVYISGDLQVKGGDLTTDQTTFNLLDTTATTINFGGDATTISIGKDSGTTTVNNNFKVNINSTLGDDTTVENTLNGKLTSNIPDNIGSAVEFKENTNSYLKFDTSNSTELTTFGTLPKVSFKNATDAGSATSAAATFDGGVGVAKKLYVGTDLNVGGNGTLGDDRTVDIHSIVGTLSVNIPDDTAIAFQVKENTQTYITAVTTNGSESVTIESTPTLLVKNATDNTLGTNASGSLQVTGGAGIAKNLTVGVDLRVTGNTVMTGDLEVRGGDITTNQTTFNLINGTATTVSAFSAATTIAIGAATGTITLGNPTLTGTALAAFNMNGTDPSIVTSSTGTVSVFNTTALTGQLFGASTTVTIGATTGTLNLRNVTITAANATAFNMNGADPAIVTSSTGTASVFNTNALTGTLFGASTTVTIGATTGTLNLRNVTITAANATAFNMNGASPSIVTSSTATASVFNTNATTGNLFGAATTIGIGASTGTLTLNNATVTTPGQFTVTKANSVTTGQGQIYLNGTTGNRIDFAAVGLAVPDINTRSVGTKILLYPGVDGSGVDFAIGLTTGVLWNSVHDSAASFKWYAGATVVLTLAGTGDLTIAGDLAVNGGDITTNQTTFNLINATATTLNIGGAATAINVGASGANTFTLNHDTLVGSQTTQYVFNATATTVNAFGASTATAIGSTTSGTTTIGYDANVKHDLTVDGDVQIKGGDLTTNQTTFNLINATATTLNIGGASTSTAIGSTSSGTTTINYDANVKHDLTVDGDVQIKGGDLTTNQTTFNLINATATTLNIGGASTATAIGSTGSGTTTINYDANVKHDLTVDGDVQIKGGDLTTNQTSFNLLNATATTISAFGAATTIGIGANTGTLTLNNAIVTTPGQFINTRASDLADGAGQLYLNGATGNRIDFNNNGVAAPTFTTRSAGSKIVLYPITTGTATDYAIGINSGTFWSSVPQYDAALTFKWYGGITEIASIDGLGNQILAGDLQVNGGDITTNQTTFNLINATATTLNIGGASTSTAIGSIVSGTTTVGYDLVVNADLQVKGGDLTTDQTTFNLLNTTATTLNIGGASTTTAIGSIVSGTTTIGYDVNVKHDLTVDGDIQIKGGDLTTDQTTFNLLNTTATTLNIGGDATTVNLGVSTGTVNIGVLALTTDLEVQYGGTGQSSFTANGVIYGNTTSGLLVTAASNPGSNATTSYGVLTTDGSNVPVWTDVIDGGTY